MFLFRFNRYSYKNGEFIRCQKALQKAFKLKHVKTTEFTVPFIMPPTSLYFGMANIVTVIYGGYV